MLWKDVPRQSISWLWKDYLLAGKFNLLVGAPGSGKTTLALSLAAAVTRAGAWPDGSAAPLGNVLVCAGGRGVEELVTPRLGACGGDDARAAWYALPRGEDEPWGFDPSRDRLGLEESVCAWPHWGLIIVDDLPAVVPGGDPQRLRASIELLDSLARTTGCPILGVAEYRFRPRRRDNLEALLAAIGPSAEAPLVLACARREDAGGAGVLVRVRSRFGPDGGGTDYRLEEAEAPDGISSTRVAWGAPRAGPARRVLADAGGEGGVLSEYGALADAMRFLQLLLADGPKQVWELQDAADGAGHAWRTMARAKAALGAHAYKERGGWLWTLGPATGTSEVQTGPIRVTAGAN
jgi:energy-coupling factor transporter ATP-binding protein EcfA2